MQNDCDIFIIGGGINGTAIAADAAGRGLRVALCEKNDLASGTSSASSKLIHGGLRYLEHYEFSLVRKSLKEREILLRRAPNLITPLEFILPHESHLRPAWMIRIGLFLYDHLASRRYLPGSTFVNLKKSIFGIPLKVDFKKGFSYYDCFTDDARLVVLNALSAKNNNAIILTRTECVSAQREKDRWKIVLKNIFTQETFFYYAKVLVNAAGPWIKNINAPHSAPINAKLDKGSHIVVPKLYDGNFAYILQNADKRVIFAIPYQNDFTLIGTTDIPFAANLEHAHITPKEEIYLCDLINQYFKKTMTPNDIVWSYAGVRCLQESHRQKAANVTRDHKLVIEAENNLPLLTVVGGKLTTHRVLAEEALKKLHDFFPDMKPAWTADTPLPGGDIANYDFAEFCQQLKKQYAWLPEKILLRYAKNYGTLIHELLKNTSSMTDLGIAFSSDLYQKEVEYLIQHEWAITSDDILWRRTKLGLLFSKDQEIKLKTWLNTRKA